jgi:hypothetical protein
MTPLLVLLGMTSPISPAQQPGVPVLPPPSRVQPAPQVPVALCLADFSRAFTPLPGRHEVWLIHPCTKQPVQVCFTLPPGRMKRFEVEDRSIEFEFDKCEVRIDFRKNGKVEIDYDD